MRYIIKKIVSKFNNWLSDYIEVEYERDITIYIKNKAIQTKESKQTKVVSLFGAYNNSMLPNNGNDNDIEIMCLSSHNYSGCLMETITNPLDVFKLRIFGKDAERAEKQIDIKEKFTYGKQISIPLAVKDYVDRYRMNSTLAEVNLKENIVINGRKSLEFELDGGEEKTIVFFFNEKSTILKSENKKQEKLNREIFQRQMMKELGRKEPRVLVNLPMGLK